MKEHKRTSHPRRPTNSELASKPKPVEAALFWSLFPRTDCIRRWVEQLKAQDQASLDPPIIGYSVFIEHYSPRTIEALADLIAATLGTELVTVNPELDPAFHTSARARSFRGKVVFLQPGRWQEADETTGHPDPTSAQGRVRLLLSRNAVTPQFIALSTSGSFAGLAAPLQRTDAFNRVFAVPVPSHEELGQIIIELCGPAALSEDVRLDPTRLGRLVARRYAGHEQRLRLQLAICQRAMQLQRALSWSDLASLVAHGFTESDPQPAMLPATRERVAWHEAGHALVEMVDSAGKNVPEMITALPSAACLGFVMSSLEYAHAVDEACTRDMLDHEIRVLLAGRAAEEIVYGNGGISDLCAGDLDAAADRLQRAFCVWGYDLPVAATRTPVHAMPLQSSFSGAFACVRQDPMLKDFLENRYQEVLDLIRANHGHLATLRGRLLECGSLFREDLEPLCEGILATGSGSQPRPTISVAKRPPRIDRITRRRVGRAATG